MLELRLKNAPTCNWNIPDSWDDSTTTMVRLLVSKNMEKDEKDFPQSWSVDVFISVF